MATVLRGPNPVWSFVNSTTGEPLGSDYYAFFLDANNSNSFKPVYPDASGLNGVTAPIQLTSGGNLSEPFLANIFFDSGAADIYQVEVRQGTSFSSPLAPGWQAVEYRAATGAGGTSTFREESDNQFTNPQFVDDSLVNLDTPGISLTADGTYDVAVGWKIELAGGPGTCTVIRNPLANNSNFDKNPPYELEIQTTVFTSVKLIQRFDNQSTLWRTDSTNAPNIAHSFTGAAVTSAITYAINYVTSSGTIVPLIAGQTLPTGDLKEQKMVPVPVAIGTANADTPPDAYIEIVMDVTAPVAKHFKVTNLQVHETDNTNPQGYSQTSSQRQVDHTFHAKDLALRTKPVEDYLVGWDFSLNPTQFGETYASGALGVASQYVWDQTIFKQTTAGANAISKNSNQFVVDNGAVTAANQLAIYQFVDESKIHDLLLNEMSVALQGGRGAPGADFECQVTIATTTAALAPPLSNFDPISAIATDGTVTLAGGWTAIPRANVGTTSVTMKNVGNGEYNVLSGWEFSGIIANVTQCVIIVSCAVRPVASQLWRMNYVNLCKTSIPNGPPPKSADEVLKECERYYEKSWPLGTPIATLNNIGATIEPMFDNVQAAATDHYVRPFTHRFKTKKRTIGATIAYYSPTSATPNEFEFEVNNLAVPVAGSPLLLVFSNNFSLTAQGDKSHAYIPGTNGNTARIPTGSSQPTYRSLIRYHYTIDARLGVVA